MPTNDIHSNMSNPVRRRLQNRVAEREQKVNLVQSAALVNSAMKYNRVDLNDAYDIIGRELFGYEKDPQNQQWETDHWEERAFNRPFTETAYLTDLKKANITQEIIDIARARPLSMEKDIIPFQDAYYALANLGHAPNSAFNFLLTMDKKRIPLIPTQYYSVYRTQFISSEWRYEDNLQSIIHNFLTLNATERANVSIAGRGPFADCWDLIDLVPPSFADTLRGAGRFWHNLDGERALREERKYKLMGELYLHGIVPNMDGIRYMSDTALTNETLSCGAVLDSLKEQGVIIPNSATINRKIEAFLAEWPQVATTRVLNNRVELREYPQVFSPEHLGMPQNQSSTNLFDFAKYAAPITLGLIAVAYMIKSIRRASPTLSFFSSAYQYMTANDVNNTADANKARCLKR